MTPEVARPLSGANQPRPGSNVKDEAGMNRREFLTYTWGAALGLALASGTGITYSFMLPRFRAGEFGGSFLLGATSALPVAGALPPTLNADGRFWLLHADEGVKALYVVCTHLGCLYNWSESNLRFECPCHGSKFTAGGDYIEGPAPRSLDQFEVEIVEDDVVVATTTETAERILPPKATTSDASIVVNTGQRIYGKPASTSPAREVDGV